MYTNSDQICLDTDQECMSHARCALRGMYTSAKWRDNMFEGNSTNRDGGYDGKCMNGASVMVVAISTARNKMLV